MSLKNPMTPPGIDPGTVRLLAQRLNHYATTGPICMYVCIYQVRFPVNFRGFFFKYTLDFDINSAIDEASTPFGTQSVLRISQGIHDQFPWDP
jgi:hypothetical protein